MRAKWAMGLVFAIMLFVQGCATVKGATNGAAEGAKEDWQALKKADGWMRENMW